MPDIKISIRPDKQADYSREFKSLKSSIRPYDDSEVMRELKRIKSLLSKDDDSQVESLKKILKSLGERLDSMEGSMSSHHATLLKRMSSMEMPDNEMVRTIKGKMDKMMGEMNKPMSMPDHSKQLDRIEKKLEKNGLPNIIYVTNKQGRTLVPYPA